MPCHREGETERQREGGTERGREGETEGQRGGGAFSLRLSAPPSLLPSVSPSLPLSVPPSLCGWSDGFVRETGDFFGARDARFRPRRVAAQPRLCELVQRGHRPEGRRGLATDRMRGADRGGERSARLR